jgi:4-hydroxybutyryl-CoA dehydratase/vinylacetyl-CoA-Delta-isomerase
MLHVDESAGDLLNKLEAVRLLCQETGCAQRYLAHDSLNGLFQAVSAHRRRARQHRAPRALCRLLATGAGRRPVRSASP